LTELEKIKKEIDSRKGKLDFINKELSIIGINLIGLKENKNISQQALGVLQAVAKQTQQKIEYKISNLVTSCINNLGKNYKFICEFVIRRDKTEADLYLTNKSGEKLDPYAEVGGSIVQIIEFALKCTIWSLQKRRVNNFMLLDEPFGAIRKNLQDKLKYILKEVSKKLNLQLIIITHDDELSKLGDKLFYLEKENGEIIVNEYN
jgi:DNA repair exonuclease SbcCD ATPase subunit